MPTLKNHPIVLLTDFGVQDAFTGIMKGVITRINPNTAIMDLTHGIEPQNVLQGAYVLATSYTYFPRNTVFCVVVASEFISATVRARIS